MKRVISSSHNTPTPDQPVPSQTLQRRLTGQLPDYGLPISHHPSERLTSQSHRRQFTAGKKITHHHETKPLQLSQISSTARAREPKVTLTRKRHITQTLTTLVVYGILPQGKNSPSSRYQTVAAVTDFEHGSSERTKGKFNQKATRKPNPNLNNV